MMPFFSEPPSRTQRLGMWLACGIIALSIAVRFSANQAARSPANTNSAWPLWDTLLQGVVSNDSSVLHPFLFNPNTVTEQQLKQMGLRNKVVQTWLHYRQKGGYFYTPLQVKRLYALRDTEFAQLASFIQIDNKPAKQEEKHLPIELNSADTSALNTLPGIGQKRALAIIQYREQLGGFYTTQQLLEIWSIDTPVFNKIKTRIKVNIKHIKPLPLLNITWHEFKQHPYFSGEVGRQILAWRKSKNYQIESLDELTEIKALDSVLFRKIVPYLSLEKNQ
jgi:competence ComEA-like helix-hairpin-helix protein